MIDCKECDPTRSYDARERLADASTSCSEGCGKLFSEGDKLIAVLDGLTGELLAEICIPCRGLWLRLNVMYRKGNGAFHFCYGKLHVFALKAASDGFLDVAPTQTMEKFAIRGLLDPRRQVPLATVHQLALA